MPVELKLHKDEEPPDEADAMGGTDFWWEVYEAFKKRAKNVEPTPEFLRRWCVMADPSDSWEGFLSDYHVGLNAKRSVVGDDAEVYIWYDRNMGWILLAKSERGGLESREMNADDSVERVVDLIMDALGLREGDE